MRSIKREVQRYANKILQPLPLCMYGGRLHLGLAGSSRVVMYRNSSLIRDKAAELRLNGILHLGVPWPATRHMGTCMAIESGGIFEAQGNYRIYAGACIHVNAGAKLSVGESGFLNSEARISCVDSIEIGSGTFIGENVMIRDTDDHLIMRQGFKESAPIKIGNRCWIASRAMILKGVEIGDGAIVAAGAVVRSNVPPKALVGGVPARVLRTDVEWS